MSIFSIFGSKLSPQEKFWKWFLTNEPRLFDFEREMNKIFRQLGSEMRKMHPSLTFEFGPKIDGRRDFVISADGNKSAFPFVVSLADKAPELSRWTIIKFRPRRDLTPEINYEGLKLKSSHVRFTIEPDGEKAAITLFVEGYDENRRKAFIGCSFLLLDNALGEYDVEIKVGHIAVKPAAERSPLEKIPFHEIRKSFDRFMASKQN
jgi:hypothetical protein